MGRLLPHASAPGGRPRRRLIGWSYRGNWYLFRSSVAFQYWQDCLREVVDASVRRTILTDRVDHEIPHLPQYAEILDQLD